MQPTNPTLQDSDEEQCVIHGLASQLWVPGRAGLHACAAQFCPITLPQLSAVFSAVDMEMNGEFEKKKKKEKNYVGSETLPASIKEKKGV
eukprot:1019361-Pelagomonas_calceolata.AAC.2